jgi:hypothetical protein
MTAPGYVEGILSMVRPFFPFGTASRCPPQFLFLLLLSPVVWKKWLGSANWHTRLLPVSPTRFR